MREPIFSPVGAGLISEETAAIQGASGARSEPPPIKSAARRSTPSRASARSATSSRSSSDERQGAARQSTPTARMTTKDGLTIDYGFNNGSARRRPSSQPAKLLGDLTSTSSTQGQGDIDRSEQIQVSVAAVVTRVLAERQSRHLGLAGGARQLRDAPTDGRRHRQSKRHLAQQHDRLRPDRRSAHLLRRPRSGRATSSSHRGGNRSMTPSGPSSGGVAMSDAATAPRRGQKVSRASLNRAAWSSL